MTPLQKVEIHHGDTENHRVRRVNTDYTDLHRWRKICGNLCNLCSLFSSALCVLRIFAVLRWNHGGDGIDGEIGFLFADDQRRQQAQDGCTRRQRDDVVLVHERLEERGDLAA